MSEPLRIEIGGGHHPTPGYINVDPNVPGAINADMGALPYPDGSVAELISIHSLEHVHRSRVVPVLREWRRVLAPGGRIVVEVPDLVWCAVRWLETQRADHFIDCIFGQQQYPGDEHRTGFSEALLVGYARQAGFVVVAIERLASHGCESLRATLEHPYA